MEQIKKFVIEFFRNLKCDVNLEGDVLVVENVPKGFEDLAGKVSPYRLSFVPDVENCEFVGKGSQMLASMTKYLAGAGKATLLRIDFDINPEAEVMKRVGLKNCSIDNFTKSYHNNFFSRFSFVTSFNYLNESDRIVSEIYVHNGKVVEGDLSGYTVVEGEDLKVDSEVIKRDYAVTKEKVLELVAEKQKEVAGILKEKVDSEVSRIKGHYDIQLKELGGDLNQKLEKIRELELELRTVEDKSVLHEKLSRLRKGLVKAGDDDVVRRILKEREMTIQDVMQKFSLNIDRKLVNTTVIYYPVYSFKLCLKSEIKEGVDKIVEVSYDPLTKEFSGLDCETCGKKLDRVSICSGGHLSCDGCLDRCGECGEVFCLKCLQRSCKICGKKLCKGCVKMCLGCLGSVCATHMRMDCVTGEERCVSCLRACLRCHGMSEEEYFGEALDGSKVCLKCLGAERREEVLGKGFVV